MGELECQMCGAALEDDDEYCPECGSRLTESNDEEETYDEFYENEE